MKKSAILCMALTLVAGSVLAQTSQDDPRLGPGSGIPADVAQGNGSCPGPLNVCYYDLIFGQGNPNQVPPITTAAHSPVDIVVPDAAGLAVCDVLFAQNPSNGDYDVEWSANLADIDAAVQAGMVLIFHDRFVTDAASNMPGLGATTCIRDFGDDANIDVVDNSTSVTNGPGGIIDDSSLDGGTSSSHGYCDATTLPPMSALNILSRTVTNESVLASYQHGSGFVAYSTIPLDFYLNGIPPAAFGDIYAPNVVQYGADLFCAGGGVPMMPDWAMIALLFVLLAIPTLLLRRRGQV